MAANTWIKAGVWLVLASPLLWLSYLVARDLGSPTEFLGADPGEAVVHYLGEWSLRLLLVAFSVTPAYKITRQFWIARCRRLAGLWAFAYAVLHLFSYCFFFLQFEWQELLVDLVERAYITAGMIALVLLLLMAITSTRAWRMRLGANWQRLHRVVYFAVAAAIVHFFWYTRDQFGEVVIYSLWFVLLLSLRAYYHYLEAARRSRTA